MRRVVKRNSNKVVLFLHFHKAGGTSVNNKMKALKRHYPNRNANPWNAQKNQIIPLWTFQKGKLAKFITQCQEDGVQYIACEWDGFHHWDTIDWAAMNVQLITCFRDPYKRFMSDYLLQARGLSMQDYAKEEKWWFQGRSEHQHFRVNHNRFNYYTKMLLARASEPDETIELNDTDLKHAKAILKCFHTIVILELPETHEQLGRKYLRETNASELPRRNVNTKKPDNFEADISEEEFRRLNMYDYALYDYAIELATNKIGHQKKSSTTE